MNTAIRWFSFVTLVVVLSGVMSGCSECRECPECTTPKKVCVPVTKKVCKTDYVCEEKMVCKKEVVRKPRTTCRDVTEYKEKTICEPMPIVQEPCPPAPVCPPAEKSESECPAPCP